ncbi:hypothetical protein ABFX02_09G065900 [Erythranthe guttata]
MDCNKDEAVKAKEIAVKKFTEKDFRGAKKFALKAQKMFPDLEGVSHLLAVINVYLACEKTINGEYDYYGIFGVDRFVDVQTLRNRYKKMALALHPDKNKSIGAVEAFKIISEAWEVLSGTYTRSAYDLKLNNVGSSSQTTKPQNVPTQPHIPESTTRPHVRWAASGPTSGPTRPQTQGSATNLQNCPCCGQSILANAIITCPAASCQESVNVLKRKLDEVMHIVSCISAMVNDGRTDSAKMRRTNDRN